MIYYYELQTWQLLVSLTSHRNDYKQICKNTSLFPDKRFPFVYLLSSKIKNE